MLNKIFVVGEVISNVLIGQTSASNLDFVRFKIKNKNNKIPTNFSVIGFGSKTKIANEISIGDLLFIQGQVGLYSFQNENQERICYQEIKIDDYQILLKNPAKIEAPLELKDVEVDREEHNKIFQEISGDFE
ncbi:single-stranded DNA-binding protein [Mesomycoplasma hyopneumoniae]|uniref:single-stranded DNA-binding protein n=1 Tax=Mesomycoplasma hyopneumoniae TaxID=2099 RepID=UPI003DA26CD9